MANYDDSNNRKKLKQSPPKCLVAVVASLEPTVCIRCGAVAVALRIFAFGFASFYVDVLGLSV